MSNDRVSKIKIHTNSLGTYLYHAHCSLQFHNSNAQLDLLIGELREKLDEMQAQNLDQRKRIADQEASRGRLQVDPRCLSLPMG